MKSRTLCLFALTFAITGVAFARSNDIKEWKDASNPDCPLAISKLQAKIYLAYSDIFGTDEVRGSWTATVQNKASRDAVGAQVVLRFFDSSGDYITLYTLDTGKEEVRLKPSGTYSLATKTYVGRVDMLEKASRVEASVTYVRFGDGTIWETSANSKPAGTATQTPADSTASAQTDTTPALTINGTTKLQLTSQDGRFYVAVDDLARGLGGRLEIQGNKLSLTLPDKVPVVTEPTTTAKTPSTGAVSGTVACYDTRTRGRRPDTGAIVCLMDKDIISMPGSITIKRLQNKTLVLLDDTAGKESENCDLSIKAQAITDGSGRFDLRDVATGEYTLLVQSANDPLKRCHRQAIIVRTNESTDASYDFGTL